MSRHEIEQLGYSIDLEFCGYESKRFVLRLRGEFVGSFAVYQLARNAANRMEQPY